MLRTAVMSCYGIAATAFFSALFVTAAALKLTRSGREQLGRTLHFLVPSAAQNRSPLPRAVLAPLIIAPDFAVAIALLVTEGIWRTFAVIVTFAFTVGFAWVQTMARKHNQPCGCFGSTRRELRVSAVGRSVVLSVMAGLLLLVTVLGEPPTRLMSLLAFLAFVLLALFAAMPGPRIFPRATYADERSNVPVPLIAEDNDGTVPWERPQLSRRSFLSNGGGILGGAASYLALDIIRPIRAFADPVDQLPAATYAVTSGIVDLAPATVAALAGRATLDHTAVRLGLRLGHEVDWTVAQGIQIRLEAVPGHSGDPNGLMFLPPVESTGGATIQ